MFRRPRLQIRREHRHRPQFLPALLCCRLRIQPIDAPAKCGDRVQRSDRFLGDRDASAERRGPATANCATLFVGLAVYKDEG